MEGREFEWRVGEDGDGEARSVKRKARTWKRYGGPNSYLSGCSDGTDLFYPAADVQLNVGSRRRSWQSVKGRGELAHLGLDIGLASNGPKLPVLASAGVA